MSTQPKATPPDLIIGRLLDGRVLSIIVPDSSRSTVDRYVEFVKQEQLAQPAGTVTYILSDFSSTLAGFNTPYGRARMNELTTLRSDIFTYIAVIIANGFMVQIARVAMNAIHRQNIQTHICFSQEEALAWLQKMMAKEASKAK